MQYENIAVQKSVPAIAVGSNDKVHVAESAAEFEFVSVGERVMALVAERKAWELGACYKSNEQLYALLDKCYAFYFDLSGNGKEEKKARAKLNDLISKKGYSFKESTHLLTKLVKFVFEGVDRRRVSAYGLVLREALAQGVNAGAIAEFIRNGGGVEEIRRSKSKTAKTAKQKAQLGKCAIEGKQLAVVAGGQLGEAVDVSKAGKELVAIVTQQADGSLVVRALVQSESVLNAALAAAYTQNKRVVENDKKNAEAANENKLLDAAIAAARN